MYTKFQFNLPMLNCEADNIKYRQQTIELMEHLAKAIDDWLGEYSNRSPDEHPYAYCIGSGAYLAAMLYASGMEDDDPRKGQIRQALMYTMVHNEPLFQLPIPPAGALN